MAISPSPWLILAEFILSLFCHFLSFTIFGIIVLKRKYRKNYISSISSPCITLYFYSQIIASFIAIFYLSFLCIGWKINSPGYNSYLMFYFGMIQTLCIIIIPVSTFAVGLDRCLCVGFPLKYSNGKNYYLLYLAIFLMFALIIISLIFMMIPAYPKTDITLCSSFGCMITAVNYFLYVRCFDSTLILIICILLLIMKNRKLHLTEEKTKKFNNTVFATLLITFILDFLPHFTSIVFYPMVGINLSSYVGPYSTVTSAIESALCALQYRSIYRQQKVKFSLPVFSNVHH